LKTITYDNFWWILVGFPEEEYRWISENDLTEEQQEYLYSMSPFQIELENSFENEDTTALDAKITECMNERKELLLEMIDLWKGVRRECFLRQQEEFAEDQEERIREFEIKIIEYEDDINLMKEELTDFKIKKTTLQQQNFKYQKWIKELNQLVQDLAQGRGDNFIQAAR